jgi:hypothetical protein
MDTKFQYVPVLRWRQGEKNALKDLPTSIKQAVLPLIEIIENNESIDIVDDIMSYWRNSLVMIDLVHHVSGEERLMTSIKKGAARNWNVIPVISSNSSDRLLNDAKSIAHESNHGLAIRVSKEQLLEGDQVNKALNSLVKEYSIAPSETMIVVDFGLITDEDSYMGMVGKVSALPYLKEWSKLVVSGGCMPKDLSDFEPGQDNYLDRYEWVYWKKYQDLFNRDTVYSDYTTRHPYYDGAMMPFGGSKSIRYSLSDKVRIIRGRKQDPSEMYLSHAATFCDYSGEFYGEEYSEGDKFIMARRNLFYMYAEEEARGYVEPQKKTGSPATWVTASVNHHINVVVKENLGIAAV